MKYLKKHRDEMLIFSFFIFLSIVVTYPLVFKMKSYVYGQTGDPLGMIWFFWWLKHAGIKHISPLFCSLLAAPWGIDYSQIEVYKVSIFFITRLSLLTNEVFTYNLMTLAGFLLAPITMYFLVYYFTRNKLASMISGIIYGFCPYHFTQAAQHLGLASIQWMPLYLLALFLLAERREYKYALLTALSFFLVVFTDYQLTYFMLVLTVTFVLWRIWQGLRGRNLSSYQVIPVNSDKPGHEAGKQSSEQRAESGEQREEVPRRPSDRAIEMERREDRSPITDYRSLLKTMKVFLVAIVVALAIILPFTYRSFQNMFATPERYVRPLRDLFSNSARPLGYLLPSRDNPIFGRYTEKFIDTHFYGGHPVEHTLYLGWVGIVLSMVAIREWHRKNKKQRAESRERRSEAIKLSSYRAIKHQTSSIQDQGSRIQKAVSFFLFAGIVALLFSYAPYTDIGNFRIFFPSYFMYKILPMVRVYARFGIVVMLCVSVLAGIGLASILKKIRNTKKKRIFFSIALLLIFIEFAPTLPAPMVNAVNPPPVYEWLAKQEGDFIIAEYPLENDVEYLFWQRIHQKRLVNGALSVTYADKVRKEIVDILKPETPGILKHLGARYIILHPNKYLESEDVPVIGEVPDLSKQKGLRLLKTFEKAQVYEIVAKPTEPTIED